MRPLDQGAAARAPMPAKVTILFLGRVAAFGFAFVTPIVLVRVFAPEEFGLYKQLFLIQGTFAAMLTLGLPASLFYFVPRHPDERHLYLSQTLFVLLAVGLACGLALVAFRSQVASGINNPAAETYLPYVALLVLTSLATSTLETTMVATNDVKLAAGIIPLSELAKSGLIVGGALLWGDLRLVVAAACAWGLMRLGFLTGYLRAAHGLRWLRPGEYRLGPQLRYSCPLGGARILRTLSETLPHYVVSYVFTPTLFAVYAIGAHQLPFVTMAAESVSDVTLVRLTRLWQERNLRAALALIHRSVTKLALLLFPLSVLLFVVSPSLIVLLYTERFAASIPIFQIFLLAIPLTAVGLDQAPRAFDDTPFLLRVQVARLLLGAGLVVGLVQWVGLAGAALAPVAALALTKGWTVLWVKRRLGVTLGQVLPWRDLAKIAAASALAGSGALAIRAAGGLDPLPQVGLEAGLFLAGYAGLAWAWGLVSRDDVRKVMAMTDLVTARRPAA